jgi:hypothetical protein
MDGVTPLDCGFEFSLLKAKKQVRVLTSPSPLQHYGLGAHAILVEGMRAG